MRLRPVIDDTDAVVDAVTEVLTLPARLHSELDVDVYRLRPAAAPDLVVRVFDRTVERAVLDCAATVLDNLGGTRFPAERCVATAPVIELDGGAHLFVTEYVEPRPAPGPGFVLAWCAALLGRLATRTGDGLVAGGGWHRLAATPAFEIDAALRLGEQVDAPIGELLDLLAGADDASGLPEALIHADLTPPNAVPQGADGPLIIDWVGVGRGPRVWPLAFLLFATGPRAARRAADRYERSVELSSEEWERLPGIMLARPLTLDVWSVAYERMTAKRAVDRARRHRAKVAAVMTALRESARPTV